MLTIDKAIHLLDFFKSLIRPLLAELTERTKEASHLSLFTGSILATIGVLQEFASQITRASAGRMPQAGQSPQQRAA